MKLPGNYSESFHSIPPKPNTYKHLLKGAVSPCEIFEFKGSRYIAYIGASGKRESDGGPANRTLAIDKLVGDTREPLYNPVLEYFPNNFPSNKEEEGIFSATFIPEGDTLHCYFGGIIAVGPNEVRADVLHTTSQDVENWTEPEIVVSHDSSVYGAGDELFPYASYKSDGKYYVYYGAKGRDGQWVLGVAWGSSASNLPNTRKALDRGKFIINAGPAIVAGNLVHLPVLLDFGDRELYWYKASKDKPWQLSVNDYKGHQPYRHATWIKEGGKYLRAALNRRGDSIDFTRSFAGSEGVVWIETNPMWFDETSEIERIWHQRDHLCFDHTKSGEWPVDTSQGQQNATEGNVFGIAKSGNKWLGWALEWMRPGQKCKIDLTREKIGLRLPKFDRPAWVPEDGERFGVLMTTPAISGQKTIDERSNIAWKRWNQQGLSERPATFNTPGDRTLGPKDPEPVPDPVVPTGWGLITFDRLTDPDVRVAIRENTSFNFVVVNVPPRMTGWDASSAISTVQLVELGGFRVIISLSPNLPEKEKPASYHKYTRRVIEALPNRVYWLDTEVNNLFNNDVQGYINTISPVLDRINENNCLSIGPGANLKPDHLDQILSQVKFNIPSIHAYTDQGEDTFKGWVNEAEEIIRSYGYDFGIVGEYGEHGEPITSIDKLCASIGNWNPDKVQIDRLRKYKRFWDEKMAEGFWKAVMYYQIFDRADEKYTGFGLLEPEEEGSFVVKPAAKVFSG